MPVIINIRGNLKPVKRFLNNVKRKQLPFARAVTLTKLAKEVQKEVQSQMPQRFNLRRRWIVQGLRIKPAKKNDLESEVFHKDEFMFYQEEGGLKRPFHGGHLTIPLSGINTRRVPPRSKRPRNLRNTFREENIIYQRQGRKGKRVRPMWLLKPTVRVKPRLGLAETGKRIVSRRTQAIFSQALARALRTARR